MKLIDSSVWIDYLRSADSRASSRLRELLSTSPDDVAICEPIAMELLAGASSANLAKIEQLVNGLHTLRIEVDLDYRVAAELFRSTRAVGRRVRSLNDCLIAAIAIRHGATLVHKDADFDAIGLVAQIELDSLR